MRGILAGAVGLQVLGAASAALVIVGPRDTAAQARVPQAARAGTAPTHGVRPARLVIRGAMLIEGNGTPAEGPRDIVIEGDRIVEVISVDAVALANGTARRPASEVEIEATGKDVVPGLINLDGHVQDERGGVAQPLDYQFKLWLGMGITSVRDVLIETRRTLQRRTRSAAGEGAAPRLFVYARYAYRPIPRHAVEARQRVRDLKAQGVDGLQLFGMDKDVSAAVLDESRTSTAYSIFRQTPTTPMKECVSGTRDVSGVKRIPHDCRTF